MVAALCLAVVAWCGLRADSPQLGAPSCPSMTRASWYEWETCLVPDPATSTDCLAAWLHDERPAHPIAEYPPPWIAARGIGYHLDPTVVENPSFTGPIRFRVRAANTYGPSCSWSYLDCEGGPQMCVNGWLIPPAEPGAFPCAGLASADAPAAPPPTVTGLRRLDRVSTP